MSEGSDFISLADLDAAAGPHDVAPGWDQAPPSKRFPLEMFRDIRPELVGQWRVKHLLGATGLAVIFGPPGCGKTFLALSIAVHIAAGRDFAGRRTKQTGVVYVAAEAGGGVRKRVAAIGQEMALPAELAFALVTVAPNLGKADGDAAALISDIRASGLEFGVVVLDTLARVIPDADENSSRDIGIFVANADRIARELNALVIAVHHTGKNIANGMRGSSALHGAADTELEVSEANGGRTVKIVKQKDAEGDASFNFRLRSVTVGADEDGDPVTTCVVDELTEAGQIRTREPKADMSGKIPTGLRLFMSAFEGALANSGSELRPFHDGPLLRAVRAIDVRGVYYSSRPDDQPDARLKGFKRNLAAAAEKELLFSRDIDGETWLWR